jgi:L-alanine-DL-glutamate epimerase-like enolase superfamily enzyme
MHITRLEAWSVAMPLSEPYTIAYETVDSTTNVFLRLHTNTPLVGLGCAAPDPYITGETPADVLSRLEQAGLLLSGLDPTRPASVYARLQQALEGPRAAPSYLAALDMALLDLLGKFCGLPLWKLLGGARESIPGSMTIGILDEQETVEQARRWAGEGFSLLKLKGGLDPGGDAVRVSKVREAVGPAIRLAFDANGGYTVEQSLTFLTGCAGAAIEFLEQPTSRQDANGLGEVQRRTSVPVMADEGLTTPRQALELANGPAVRLFNIKLMKVGGIRPALAIDAIGESAGVGVMVGCLDESALAIAAGLHFALARPNVAYADLDAHFALVRDPAAGAVACRDGVLYPGPDPGLGVILP